MNKYSYDTLKTTIECAMHLAFMQDTLKVVTFANSTWDIHSYERNCPKEGIFVNGYGITYVLGESYQAIHDELLKRARDPVFVDTQQYTTRYQKPPRGSDQWCFEILGNQYFFKDSYSKAKHHAIKTAKAVGTTYIELIPQS